MTRRKAPEDKESGWATGSGEPVSVSEPSKIKPPRGRKRAAKKKPRKTSKKNAEDEPRKPGRPPKSTPERLKAMVKAAERPLTMEGIARAGGISISTLSVYREEFPEFSAELTRARAETEERLVDRVEDEDPKFLLERSYRYMKHLHVEGGLEVSVPEESRKRLRAVFPLTEDEDEPRVLREQGKGKGSGRKRAKIPKKKE